MVAKDTRVEPSSQVVMEGFLFIESRYGPSLKLYYLF